MVSAIKTWTSAGFPRQKILMGLAAYGYINHASATTLVHRKRDGDIPQINRRFNQYLSQARKRQNACSEPSSGGAPCPSPNSPPPPPQSTAQTPAPANSNQTSAPSVDQDILPSINQTRTANINQTQNVEANLTTTTNATSAEPNLTTTPPSAEPNSTTPTTTSPVFVEPGQNDTAGQVRTASSGVGSGNMEEFSGSQIQFKDLFKWGVVALANSEGRLDGINGYQVAWDRCSSTVRVPIYP